ncbi:MAG: DUF6882 domain-containing protein [Polyangiales bacterium]
MIDDRLRKLAALMQGDVMRGRERHAARISGHDAMVFDERGTVQFRRGPAVLHRARAEVLASFSPELGLFRWGWAGRGSGAAAVTIDGAFREGRRQGLQELTCEQLTVDSEDDARLLIEVAAQLVRAEAVVHREEGTRVVFFALFDGGSTSTSSASMGRHGDPRDAVVGAPGFRPAEVGTFSLAPPTSSSHPTSRTTAPPMRSLPPMAPIEVSRELEDFESVLVRPAPRSTAPSTAPGLDFQTSPPPPGGTPMERGSIPTPAPPEVRQPSRATFFPLAQLALGHVAAVLPGGFRQALLVITIDVQASKGRFFVQLVASDARGDLLSLEPSRDLLDATARFIGEDAREGNSRWRRLVARLTATAKGASVDVEVKA